MIHDQTFDDLMARLRVGDEEAAAEVYKRFVPQLLGLIHHRLDRRLRATVDADDVLQSVFRTFFVRNAEGKFALADWDGLMGILTVIALRKCSRRARYFRAARRNVRRQISITSGTKEDSTDLELEGRETPPSEQAVMAEIIEKLMRGLDVTEQPVLLLSLQGNTPAEISRHINRSERTVQRVLKRLRRRLEHMCHEEETDSTEV